MKLEGKVAVITGASMGIGEAIAKLFVQEGAKVVLCSRDLARTKAAEQRIGGGANTLSVACDVSKREQVDALVKAAVAKFGRIDIFVNNAGFGLNDAVADMDMAEFRRMFDTNLFGAVECMQAVIPIMRQQGGGDIVNISSVSGHIATPYMSGYAATKHAMNAIGKAGRMELLRHNINVLTVCPGYIATDFVKNMVKGKHSERVGSSVKYARNARRCSRRNFAGLAQAQEGSDSAKVLQNDNQHVSGFARSSGTQNPQIPPAYVAGNG